MEALQESIDKALANVSVDGIGGGAAPPATPIGIEVPSPGSKEDDSSWTVEVAVCLGVVITILIVLMYCYKRFC